MTDETPEARASNLATINLGRDLLKSMVDVIRTAQKPWHKLTEEEQQQLIDRLRDETDEMVRKAINTLLTGDYASVPAKVHQVVFQDGIKANLQIDGTAPYRHELADAAGAKVLLVIADPADYLQSMDQVKADADQPDMFEVGEPEPLDLLPPATTGAADVAEGDDGLPEALEPDTGAQAPPAGPESPDPGQDDPMPEAPPPVQHQKPIGDGAPDDLVQPENLGDAPTAEPEVPPPANEAQLIEPGTLRGKLAKIQIDVPLAIIEGWQENERLNALRFASAFWEAVQLEDQPPQPPFFLLPYTPNG